MWGERYETFVQGLLWRFSPGAWLPQRSALTTFSLLFSTWLGPTSLMYVENNYLLKTQEELLSFKLVQFKF